MFYQEVWKIKDNSRKLSGQKKMDMANIGEKNVAFKTDFVLLI
jgi:hypothetical protein